jgi:adenosylcobyric acid synthase
MGVTEPVQQNGQTFARLQQEGKEKAWEDGWVSNDGYIFGTYVHGLFDSPYLRTEMLNRIRKTKGLKLKASAPGPENNMRLKQYDRLADHFEAHCDVERIFRLAGITGVHSPVAR